MSKKLIFTMMLIASIAALISLPLTTPTFAQDTTPTPIASEGDENDGGIAPPSVDVPATTEEAITQPEATAAVEGDTDTTTSDPIVETASVCPVAVQSSYTAIETLCTDVASGEACVGNGTVDSVFGADSATGFAQANDRSLISSLDQITLISGSTWTIIRAELELATVNSGAIVSATMFAYGNLSLIDTGRVAAGGAQNGTVLAERGMNVRREPGNDGVVVWQLQGGQEIIVTGISADREWIRMVIPNEFAGTGWVYAPYVEVEGGDEILPIVTVNSPVPDLAPPEFAPGQAFELVSALPPTDCEEAVPVSGLLIQSPSGTPESLKMLINSAEIQFNGTIFVQAQAGDILRISVLEGEATALFNGSQATATVNNRINIPLDINLVVNGAPQSELFSASELPDVPTRILPRNVAFGISFEEETASDDSANASGFGTAQPTTAAETCTLTASEIRNVRAGASTEFEVVQVLQKGDSVEGIGQATGELNLVWYQTANGGWIRIDTIDASASCASLPVVEAPALPEPSPESDESDNAGNSSLSSSTLPELSCGGDGITGSATSDGTQLFVSIGGTWTVSAGTSVTFTTQNGLLRPELGDYIQLVTADGTVLGASGEGRSLTVTFDSDTTFEARFSAANGDLVVMAASCQ